MDVFILKFLFFYLITLKFSHGQLMTCNTERTFTATGQRLTINWPEQQNPQAACEYVVKSPVDTYILVRMAYDLYISGGNCYDQYVRVAADGNAQYAGSSTFCGYRESANPLQFKTLGNELRIIINCNDNARKVQIVLDTYAVTQSTCICGVSNAGRIANGHDTSSLEFTGHVGFKKIINRFDESFCGGTIISQNHVLTAAHCITEIQRFGLSEVKMHVGRQNINVDPSQDTPYATVYNIRYLAAHPQYSSETNANDIGIVVPSSYIRITRGVIPACIPFGWRGQNLPSGTTMVAIGFGGTEYAKAAYNDPKSWILQSTQLVVDSSLSPCNTDTTKICAKGVLNGDVRGDSCQRDSGGGFYGYISGLYNIFGITSEGTACGIGDSYSINTNVLSHISWIEQVVGSTFLCRKS